MSSPTRPIGPDRANLVAYHMQENDEPYQFKYALIAIVRLSLQLYLANNLVGNASFGQCVGYSFVFLALYSLLYLIRARHRAGARAGASARTGWRTTMELESPYNECRRFLVVCVATCTICVQLQNVQAAFLQLQQSLVSLAAVVALTILWDKSGLQRADEPPRARQRAAALAPLRSQRPSSRPPSHPHTPVLSLVPTPPPTPPPTPVHSPPPFPPRSPPQSVSPGPPAQPAGSCRPYTPPRSGPCRPRLPPTLPLGPLTPDRPPPAYQPPTWATCFISPRRRTPVAVVEDDDPVPLYPGDADRMPRTVEELEQALQSGPPFPPPPPAYFRTLEARYMPADVRQRLIADIAALRIDEPWKTSWLALWRRRERELQGALSPHELAEYLEALNAAVLVS